MRNSHKICGFTAELWANQQGNWEDISHGLLSHGSNHRKGVFNGLHYGKQSVQKVSSIRFLMRCFIAFVNALLVYKTAIIYSATDFMRRKSQQMRELYGNTVYRKIQNSALMTMHTIWSMWQLAFGVFHLAHKFTLELNALLTITWSSNETSGFVFCGNEQIFAQ